MEPIGVVAGSGDLPGRLIAELRRQGRATVVIALKDHADRDVLNGVGAHWFRIGEAGSAIKLLREAGCRDLVMAGAVRRPGMLQLMPDAATAAFFAKVGFKALGDDGLLRAVIQHLETEYGFRVRAVEDIVPGLLGAPTGPLGRHAPDQAAWIDIGRGVAVLNALAPVDVGQAVVVQQGLVLGVEAIEGTDRLLARVGEFARPGAGGVLVKLAKPGQETRADRPTLGPATVEGALTAGLRGIAFDARAALLVDRESMVARADAAGLFLLALDPSKPIGGAP